MYDEEKQNHEVSDNQMLKVYMRWKIKMTKQFFQGTSHNNFLLGNWVNNASSDDI